ncbi:MAG: hypothetical protein OXG85_09580 [Chloroflexi bacterium]|nr:hypothetical protein [Chloroflexota bacterium]
MRRFLRALIQAIGLTLRGESLTPPHYRPLETWIAAGLDLLGRVEELAPAEGVDLEAIQLKLDGRPTSLARSLDMIRHNLVDEYPRLIRLDDPYSMMVVQASNFNDQYRISQFLAADIRLSPELQSALFALNAHLLNLPQIDRPEADA